MSDPRLLAEHLEFFLSPTDDPLDALVFQEMEGLDYAYETMWKHVEENVNPQRERRGLEPMTREGSDAFARGMVNFCRRLELQREAGEEQGDDQQAQNFFQLLVDEGLATHDPMVIHTPFEIMPRKDFVLTAPDIGRVLLPNSIPEHRRPPKWQKNLPPQVKRELGGKGHRYRGGGKGRRGR